MQHTFLSQVAQSLRQKFGTNLANVVVIFPNKRANLFLNDYLACDDEQVMAPQYLSIKEFFCALSPLTIANPIETVIRIYKLFKQLSHTDATLDNFYGWGERILADFEDVDKNLGDARLIFRDLKDYQTLSTEDDWLDEEQKATLKHFAVDFQKNEGEIRQRYNNLWTHMLQLYTLLREQLQAEGQAYEGQLYRDVAEGLEAGDIVLPTNVDKVVFVGFNVLDEVEKSLFSYLKAQGKALFYWDYDQYYVKKINGEYKPGETEAGTFLADNLNRFGNELDDAYFDNLRQHKPHSITFAKADTDTIQAQYITQWLQPSQAKEQNHVSHYDKQHARETAVVLCDEKMLQPALHALPFGEDEPINITMGYPLAHTAAFAQLSKHMDEVLNTLSYTTSQGDTIVIQLANNPTLTQLQALLDHLQTFVADKMLESFSKNSNKQEVAEESTTEATISEEATEEAESWLGVLQRESYYQLHKVIADFQDLIATNGTLIATEQGSTTSALSFAMLFKLIRQVIRRRAMPFHGEPAIGLQVMGMLETRCLDFRHVLLLSTGEGILPQKATDASFIPFTVRSAHHLTTYVKKTAVFAYYFYRLMQRTETITLLYNCSTIDTRKGEMSRFMRNMLIDPTLLDKTKFIHLKSTPIPSKPMQDKRILHDGKSKERFDFSPSALTQYLTCPRSYYYKYVAKINAQRADTDIISVADFGTVVHKTAELLFTEVLNQGNVTPSRIEACLKDKALIDNLIDKAFAKEGKDNITFTKSTVSNYINKLLRFEKSDKTQVTSFEFVKAEFGDKSQEERCEAYIKNPSAGQNDFKIYGKIDRIDLAEMANGLGKCFRVIDYKTGGQYAPVKDMDELFNYRLIDNEETTKGKGKKGDKKPQDKFPKYVFQTFVYCLILKKLRESRDGNQSSVAQTLRRNPDAKICPALYYINQTSKPDYTPYLQIGDNLCFDFDRYAAEFEDKLVKLLVQITDADPNKEFEGIKYNDRGACSYCDYRALCHNK